VSSPPPRSLHKNPTAVGGYDPSTGPGNRLLPAWEVRHRQRDHPRADSSERQASQDVTTTAIATRIARCPRAHRRSLNSRKWLEGRPDRSGTGLIPCHKRASAADNRSLGTTELLQLQPSGDTTVAFCGNGRSCNERHPDAAPDRHCV
jgi:hypothetical protein